MTLASSCSELNPTAERVEVSQEWTLIIQIVLLYTVEQKKALPIIQGNLVAFRSALYISILKLFCIGRPKGSSLDATNITRVTCVNCSRIITVSTCANMFFSERIIRVWNSLPAEPKHFSNQLKKGLH